MFRHRQQLRRWAAQVLLAWLFGVGIGVAHACLSSNLTQPSDPAAAHATDAGMPHHGATAAGVAHTLDSSQAQADAGTPGEPGSAARSTCVDYCDKVSIQVPLLKSALDDAQVYALPLTAVALVVPVPALESVQLWVPRRDGVWALPIPIAFLRLAL